MKKLLIAVTALLVFGFSSNVKSQNSYIEANFGMSVFTQTYNIDAGPLHVSPETDINVMNLSVGYNYALSQDLFVGATLGYSKHSGDNLNFGVASYTPEVSLYTISPKLTYYKVLGNTNFYWTPNFYLTVGFGKEEFVAGYDVKYMNYRIGFNPLSFDFRILPVLSVNVTALTPYYNIFSASLSGNGNNYDISTDNAFVYLGGQIGIKLHF